MARTYWISFSISQSGARDRRYQALLAAVRGATSDIWWTESTDFLMFHSDQGIYQIAGEVAASIDAATDLALLSTLDGAEALAIGAVEDPTLFVLMPEAMRYDPEKAASPSAGLSERQSPTG